MSATSTMSSRRAFRSELYSKINLLGDRLAVAWSGPVNQAERAMRVLARVSDHPDLTLEKIGRELDAIEAQSLNRLQLIGTLLGDARGAMRSAHCFAYGVKGNSTASFGTVFAAGTGRDFFLNLLGKSDWTNSGTGNEFQVAHVLLSALTNKEYRIGSTILNRWGGGFEAVTCSQVAPRFEKVGDILHTFWRMRERADDSLGFTPMFYKTRYWRDGMIIRSARFEETGPGSFKLASNDLTLVPPLLRQVSDYNLTELGEVDFSYRAICCHVAIEKSNGQDILFFVEQREHQRDFEFEFDASSVRLHISSNLTSAILDEVRKQRSEAITHADT